MRNTHGISTKLLLVLYTLCCVMILGLFGGASQAESADPYLFKGIRPGNEKLDSGNVVIEAEYILKTRCSERFDLSPSHPGYGALNNVFPGLACDYIVPRENAMAILGLMLATQITGNSKYLNAAQETADFLASNIRYSDGSWYNQYRINGDLVEPYDDVSRSPTQAAETMIAFAKLGYAPNRWMAMQNGASYLLKLQDPAYKGDGDDGLLGGGWDAKHSQYHTHRWTHDNSYAYLALKAASVWAVRRGETTLATQYSDAANRILNGINTYLLFENNGAHIWHTRIDEHGITYDTPLEGGPSQVFGWINYAPQMLDLPATGVGNPQLGEWIHQRFQEPNQVPWDGAVSENHVATTKVCGENGGVRCLSPGYSFQASLVWHDLGQSGYAGAAIDWAENSGLWQKTVPDGDGITGGWIDWVNKDSGTTAEERKRFIDTSFYAIAAWNGGFNFSSLESNSYLLWTK